MSVWVRHSPKTRSKLKNSPLFQLSKRLSREAFLRDKSARRVTEYRVRSILLRCVRYHDCWFIVFEQGTQNFSVPYYDCWRRADDSSLLGQISNKFNSPEFPLDWQSCDSGLTDFSLTDRLYHTYHTRRDFARFKILCSIQLSPNRFSRSVLDGFT